MAVFSLIKKSELEGLGRIDAEYYQPKYLDIQEKLLKAPHESLKDIAERLVSFGAYSLTSKIEWSDDGIPFFVAENVKEGFLDLENARCISEETDEILQKSRVKEGMVLLAMSGSVGNAAVAHDIPEKLNSNQDVVKITLKKGYSPYFLAAFLNSKYGKNQVLRLPVGSVQQHIFLWQTETVLIPKFSPAQTKYIEDTFVMALKEGVNSTKYYNEAEKILLRELGIKESDFADELSYVVSLSDAAERTDAEYFQPKYERILATLSKKKLSRLTDSFEIIRGKNINYSNDGEVGVIKTKQLGDSFINFDVESNIDLGASKKGTPLIRDRDILFASMGVGSLGKTNMFYEFERPSKNFTIDSTLRIFRENKSSEVQSEVLAVYFKSRVGQELIYKYIVGSSGIISIYSHYLEDFPVPVLPQKVQTEIADLVQKSHAARQKSKALLDQAKHQVEQLIEKRTS
jgi:restriction endonuclease S subunit